MKKQSMHVAWQHGNSEGSYEVKQNGNILLLVTHSSVLLKKCNNKEEASFLYGRIAKSPNIIEDLKKKMIRKDNDCMSCIRCFSENIPCEVCIEDDE